LHKAILAFALLSNLLPFMPVAAQEEIVLEAASDQGTFTVEIAWTTGDIGSANAFELRFVEPETGVEIEDVIYDFSIYKDSDREVVRRDQMATQQEFTFDEQGPYEIKIDNIEGLGEGVSVPIEVTPEFPASALAVVAGALGGAGFLASRYCNNLFRLHGK
jgi:hypothetical protein